MHLFLTHIDTPYRMLHEQLSLSDKGLAFSTAGLSVFGGVCTVLAFWSDKHLSDEEAWLAWRAMREDARHKLTGAPFHYICDIEDARLLGDSPLSRLTELWRDGVRLITPMWRGVNRLGGAYDTTVGLTPYGRRVLCAAMEMGMMPDISHAGQESAKEILSLARHYRTPVCASHSNFTSVCAHPRNLTDAVATAVAESGGFIGLCFVPEHVGGARNISALLAHYAHGLTLGLTDALCLGTDFDGTDELICGITGVESLPSLAAEMEHAGYTDTHIRGLFGENAHRIFSGVYPDIPFY